MNSAGVTDDEINGEDDVLGNLWAAVLGEPGEEELGGEAAEGVGGLAHDGHGGADDVGHLEVVKAHDRDLRGDLYVQGGERVQGVAHHQVVGAEERGRRKFALEQRANGLQHLRLQLGYGVVIGLQAGRFHGGVVAREALALGPDVACETEAGDAAMAMLDQVLHAHLGAALVLHDDAVEGASLDRPVQRYDRRAFELRVAELGFAGRRNDDEAFDVPPQHALGFDELGCRIFVRGGDDGGVGVLLGHEIDGVRALREEGVVEVGNEDADLAGALVAQRAGDLVGHVVQLGDRVEHARAGRFAYMHVVVEHPRDRHRPYARQPGYVAHACRTIQRLLLRGGRFLRRERRARKPRVAIEKR